MVSTNLVAGILISCIAIFLESLICMFYCVQIHLEMEASDTGIVILTDVNEQTSRRRSSISV